MGVLGSRPGWRLALLGINLLAVIGLSLFGPAEKSLGVNVRIVYLHGAWVWAALAAFIGAGLAGLGALALRRQWLYPWSEALGLTGLLFWLTYLPLSLWAMQANWNGLFLLEPRWRLAIAFAVSGLALQLGLGLIRRPALTAAANVGFVAVMLLLLNSVQDVMHPASPIGDSEVRLIQVFFGALLALTVLLAFQIANLWRLQLNRLPA